MTQKCDGASRTRAAAAVAVAAAAAPGRRRRQPEPEARARSGLRIARRGLPGTHCSVAAAAAQWQMTRIKMVVQVMSRWPLVSRSGPSNARTVTVENLIVMQFRPGPSLCEASCPG